MLTICVPITIGTLFRGPIQFDAPTADDESESLASTAVTLLIDFPFGSDAWKREYGRSKGGRSRSQTCINARWHSESLTPDSNFAAVWRMQSQARRKNSIGIVS
ncbi:hypothetical protein Poly51_55260 [Rubripirellula tenax]|uniref:Uncharacterized protein n=1 Tax=Rubripirellula tenax TaxID=2528015 RepID=A0A5C6EEH8_9BACT|nr:hypothetical protein Poly51_55260 [Rubripirellula tenax]